MPQKDSAEKAVRDIRRKTRRKFSAIHDLANQEGHGHGPEGRSL